MLYNFCLLSVNRYLPDSPRWLCAKGRIEEARQILIDGGNKNKRRVPINLEDLLKSDYNTGYVHTYIADNIIAYSNFMRSHFV